MDILNALKEKITGDELGQLAGFLGEDQSSLGKSLDLSITSLIQGLIHQIDVGSGVANIMNVIKDGGHSGDILDDLKGLFNNQDKTQLLVTIGNNINNHFFGSTTSLISDKIADFSSVKKTSASSVLSLAAPLVLGFLGKQVRLDRMGLSGLSHLLLEQKESVKSQLPPAIIGVFDNVAKSTTVKKETNKESESVHTASTPLKVKKVKHKKSNSNIFGVLAWIILAGLVIAAAYYSLRNRKVSEDEVKNRVENESPVNSDKVDADLFESIEEGNTPSTESKISENDEPVAASSVIPQKEQTNGVTSIEPIAANSQASRSSTSEATETQKTYPSIDRQLQGSTGWANMSASNFKRRSAELRSSDEINTLADYLNANPGKSIQIAGIGKSRLQEDRAYAIRGKLYELGIPLSRINITEGPGSTDGSLRIKAE